MVFRLLSTLPGLSSLVGARPQPPEALAYERIVDAARLPVFYATLGVPDTVEGRFDMLTLHVFLVLRRLRGLGAKEARFSQSLFDAMFQDMDDSMRELGVGDLRVGKKVRELAEMFYGRSAAYEAALEADDMAALADALSRNVFDEEGAAGAPAIAAYVKRSIAALGDTAVEDLLAGQMPFPHPETEGTMS